MRMLRIAKTILKTTKKTEDFRRLTSPDFKT